MAAALEAGARKAGASAISIPVIGAGGGACRGGAWAGCACAGIFIPGMGLAPGPDWAAAGTESAASMAIEARFRAVTCSLQARLRLDLRKPSTVSAFPPT